MVNEKYLPKGLSKRDRERQRESIIKGRVRPKTDYPKRRSRHTKAFEEKYGFKITSPRVKEIISQRGINLILSKGRGAYFSSGSRPNTTPSSWAYARLASVIMGGKARQVDKEIWNKYKKIN